MFIPSLRERKVIGVKNSPIDKATYVVTLVSSSGNRSNVKCSKEKMQELLQHVGATAPEELKGCAVVINDKRQIAFLPEGAELTIAARDKDGELIKLHFLD